MDELSKIIGQATASIQVGYFNLQVCGGDPIYRERVYCYELYHQMRLQWPNATELCLNGEIDKAAHPILKELGAAHVKPDLLVHRPGDMSRNHAVIEVKSSEARLEGIAKDLGSLSFFKNTVRYERAIYLIYGHQASKVADRVLKVAESFNGLLGIELWLHKIPGQSAEHTNVL